MTDKGCHLLKMQGIRYTWFLFFFLSCFVGKPGSSRYVGCGEGVVGRNGDKRETEGEERVGRARK